MHPEFIECQGQFIRDLQVHVPPSLTDTCQLQSLSRKRGGVSILGHQQPASSLSPGGPLPDAFQPFIVGLSKITILNVCSHRQQSFRRQNQYDGEGREAARSGPLVSTIDRLRYLSIQSALAREVANYAVLLLRIRTPGIVIGIVIIDTIFVTGAFRLQVMRL